MSDDLIYRLRKRAEIRRQISTRKSVQNNEPDRIADLLDEAADAIEGIFMEKLDMALDEVATIVEDQRQELKDLGVIQEDKKVLVKYVRVEMLDDKICSWNLAAPKYANLKLVCDVKTGKPISAEILK